MYAAKFFLTEKKAMRKHCLFPLVCYGLFFQSENSLMEI